MLSGKKQTMMSMFQSKTTLEKQADKLSAKQEELNIKSTGRSCQFACQSNHLLKQYV